jgi:ABC-type antimicrobial peptide transport system permease subunit
VHPAITARVRPPVEREFLRHLQLPRAIAGIGGVFAVVAVLTAGGGLFSVMTAAVARRRREFGIRVALGASPNQTRRGVLAEALRLTTIGVIGGAVGGWIVASSLSAFHYGVTAADPVSWTGVLATIAIASLAAAWRPALEAARVDPVKLLREE